MVSGCLGEVSAFALLAGGLWLLFRRVIPLRMPLAFLGTMAFLTYVFSKGNQGPLLWMAYELVSGGAVLAAFFLITDYTTSPVTPWARCFTASAAAR